MRKSEIFIVLFILFSIVYFNSDNMINVIDNNKVIKQVFEEIDIINDDYTFQDYYLLFDEYNLDTSNFIQTFTFFNDNNYEYKIKEIIPYINPLYEHSFKDKKFLYYSDDLGKILEEFYTCYLEINDPEIKINKINIQAMSIHTANKYMLEFLKINKSIKYRTSTEQAYKKYYY